MTTATHSLYRIKVAGALVEQEPIVGKWYCDFETRFDPNTCEEYESGGNLGEYIGEGEFVDEDGETINMSHGDYLVEQV